VPPAVTAPGTPQVAPAPREFKWEDVPDYELQQRVIRIDVAALKAGDPRYNIVIRDGDVIIVPIDTGVFYLMGEINRPGVYAFGGREVTIQRAVSLGGGFTPLAWPQRCEIIRREPGTDRQLTIPVNVDAVFAGLAPDVLLRDDDIVNVGTHFVSPFLFVIRNSFRFTYGFGFVYDRNFADIDSFGSKANPAEIRRAERQARGLPF
jgi:protein involved in polysaccharide export with SLBB domain